MKSTIFSYVSNSQNHSQKMGSIAAISALSRSFSKREVSYFRTDGFYHAPLQIIDKNMNDEFVKNCITRSPIITMDKDNNNYYFETDKYMQCYLLSCATPTEFMSGIIRDVDRRANDVKIEEEQIPNNIYVGLEEKLNFMNSIENSNIFKFDDLIDDVSKELEYKNIDYNFDIHRINNQQVTLG